MVNLIKRKIYDAEAVDLEAVNIVAFKAVPEPLHFGVDGRLPALPLPALPLADWLALAPAGAGTPSFDMNMDGSLTLAGGLAMAEFLSAYVSRWYLGWGDGTYTSGEALVSALSFFESVIVYVEPDEDGDIEDEDGEFWSVSDDPTRHVMIKGPYDYQDDASATIKEAAIYANAERAAGHESDPHLTPPDMATLGQLIDIKAIADVARSATAGGALSFILTFGTM